MPVSMAAVSEFRLSGRFSVTDSTPSVELHGQIVDAAYVLDAGSRHGRRLACEARSRSTWLYK